MFNEPPDLDAQAWSWPSGSTRHAAATVVPSAQLPADYDLLVELPSSQDPSAALPFPQAHRPTTDGSQDPDVEELRQIRDAENMGGEFEPGPQVTRRVATPAAVTDALSRLVHIARISDRQEVCPICQEPLVSSLF